MTRRTQGRGLVLLAVAFLLCSVAGSKARADARGFELNRYEPTAAGERTFMVDRPWYNLTDVDADGKGKRRFAVGLTLDYAHNLFVVGGPGAPAEPWVWNQVIEHRLTGRLDLALALRDRVLLAASVPVVLLEDGTPLGDVCGLCSGLVVGDPRIGARVRLVGQPERSRASLHAAVDFWIPVRLGDRTLIHVGDTSLRVLPRLIVNGVSGPLRWAASAGVLFRASESLGALPAGTTDRAGTWDTVGSELQIGLSLHCTALDGRLLVGPELKLGAGFDFERVQTALELLIGAHYLFAHDIQVGLAGGFGGERAPGAADGRVILRLSWAPRGR